MKYRVVRVILFLVAMAAVGAAGYSIFDLDRRAAAEQTVQQSVRDQAKTILTSIFEVTAGQRSYVAAGQGNQFWTAQVTKLLVGMDTGVRDLRSTVRSEAAASAVDSAAVALENLRKLDARAQEYVSQDQQVLASDLIFSDGLEMTGTAAAQIETALIQDLQAGDQTVRTLRRQQAAVAAGAGGFLLVVTLLLVPIPGRRSSTPDRERREPPAAELAPKRSGDARARHESDPDADINVPGLAATARLCTEFGRVMETREVPPLLARAADILDAAGLVVWLSDRAGVELRPVLSHGYSDKVVAQMRSIPRNAQNAAALAFRSAQLRVVAGTDVTSGAVVAPLITPTGCVGVLAAELRHGSEQRDATCALATILAAQVATLMGAAPSTGSAQPQAQLRPPSSDHR
jgi:GAF domain